MAKNGSVRENGRLLTMDSVESRWVFQDKDKSKIKDEEDDEDLPPQRGMDSDNDDNAKQRLIWSGLGSIHLMSKHLRSLEHNGTTLRTLFVDATKIANGEVSKAGPLVILWMGIVVRSPRLSSELYHISSMFYLQVVLVVKLVS
ncbi:Potassium transporter 7 [Camellia lanceoleosa]|uniref:Potassium transporter 7 n=1 Tax=Camellia lanceoleosa TaxID=1840588 RepID=A0ACC0IXV4_9ERIC|nr:Potassium transporter 7 [Camellia lanceoleosa]